MKAESDKATTIFAQGAATVNDYRAMMGQKPYSAQELLELYEEQNALKRGRIPGEEAAPAQPPEAKGAPMTPEEAALEEQKKEEAKALKPAPLTAA